MNTSLDENFDLACELSEKDFSHEELINMLNNGNIAERQIAALKFDKVENDVDALALMNNLTGCDGKIREAVALRINQIITSDSNSREYFNFPLVFGRVRQQKQYLPYRVHDGRHRKKSGIYRQFGKSVRFNSRG